MNKTQEAEREKKYLDNTLIKIDERIAHIKKANEIYNANISELNSYIENDIHSKINDIDDNSIHEVSNVFGTIEAYFEKCEAGLKEINKLEQCKNSPYFANISYTDDLSENKTYIGLRDIVDNDQVSIVSDWRAPISSLYYNHELGEASYTINNNDFIVNLTNKRQINIENSKLEYFLDTDTRINDELLVKLLANQKSSIQMKNIVKSIQQEQNQIIRKPSAFSLILNGVAGSGKTSIAMHRLAYLLYSDRKNLNTQSILIISPNELFSKYISTLLPELGEDNTPITSFKTLISKHFSNLAQSETKSELLEDIFQNKERQKIVEQKYGQEYAEKLFDFLENIDIEQTLKSIYINGVTIDLTALKRTYNLTKENRFRIYRKIDFIVDEILSQKFKIPKSKEENFKTQLKEVLTEEMLKQNLFEKFVHYCAIDSKTINGRISYDDVPTFAFINLSIMGFNPKDTYKQIFIDEMQDYDALSLKIIKESFPNAKFIFVGDLNQNLISSKSNLDMLKNLLPASIHYELKTSYRSTRNILQLANSVLDKTYQSPLMREGSTPTLIQTCDIAKAIQEIEKHVDKKSYLAIVCKSRKQAQEIAKILPQFDLLDSEYTNASQDIESKRIITTIYLSKGLEFDNVVIPISKQSFENEQEKQLLYTTLTRALHNVYMISEDDMSEKLENQIKNNQIKIEKI